MSLHNLQVLSFVSNISYLELSHSILDNIFNIISYSILPSFLFNIKLYSPASLSLKSKIQFNCFLFSSSISHELLVYFSSESFFKIISVISFSFKSLIKIIFKDWEEIGFKFTVFKDSIG